METTSKKEHANSRMFVYLCTRAKVDKIWKWMNENKPRETDDSRGPRSWAKAEVLDYVVDLFLKEYTDDTEQKSGAVER